MNTFSTEYAIGKRLRKLRKERGVSIEDLAMESDITPLALSNIELKNVKPTRNNLIKILDALDKESPIPNPIKREILHSSGYIDPLTPPHQKEITFILTTWKEQFKDMPFPCYLIDFTKRIYDWNDQSLLLIGESKEKLKNLTVFDLLFSPKTRGQLRLLNEEEIILKNVAYIWYEFQPYLEEKWCKNCLDEARNKYPRFGQIFDSLSTKNPHLLSMSTSEEVLLSDRNGNILTFGIVQIPVTNDPRFSVVQFVPMNKATTKLLTNF